LRFQCLADGHLQAWICPLLWGIHQGKPGFSIVTVGYKTDGLVMIPIDQQDDHLAITLVSTVVRTRTFIMAKAGHLQIERAYDL